MAFKTNPALEKFEKKHHTAFFVIRLIISFSHIYRMLASV